MSIYTFNSLTTYDQDVTYNANFPFDTQASGPTIAFDTSNAYDIDLQYGGSAFSPGVKYDANFQYDNPLVYDSGSKTIVVGNTHFFLTGYVSNLIGSSDKGIHIPRTSFVINTSVDTYKVGYIKFTGEPIPGQHIEDAQQLDADAYVDLFQIILSDKTTKIYLRMGQETDWQGNTYESSAVKIDGVGRYADDEVARPKLSLFNPEGVYSSLVDQGLLDAGTIVRYRVLKYDVDNDRPVYRRQQWKVSRVATVSSNAIVLELRDLMDGQVFSVPGRMFIPPDFPTVGI